MNEISQPATPPLDSVLERDYRLNRRQSPEERSRVTNEFNATARPYPKEKLIHQLFEEMVGRTPDAIAIVHEGQSLTYAALNRRANQLANYLRRKGVAPDTLVGICLERSLEMVVGLLGILKAGGAYVPLDPSYPSERLSYMLQDAAPGIVVTQERLRSALPGSHATVIALDSGLGEIESHDSGNLDPQALKLRSDHLAYVIYTSGSTGRPKGAMNEHRAVVNRLVWMQNEYRLHAGDRVLQKTPFSFDVSAWEFFWTLISGACLIIARPEGHRDPAYLEALIEATEVTTLHFVPSMLQVFLQHHVAGRCPSLRHIICSGEELSASLQNRCLAAFPHAKLSNLYGPTECAIDVTAWECTADADSRRVPIGRPIANTQIYILDSHREPVPIGLEGEIFIAGDGVGRGYWRRPELTAERFVTDPFSAEPNARMYKTGDLGRWRADGAIEYLGRNDHQVKIRGFRIELGEIESRLGIHPDVEEAVVLAREDAQGDKRLVAYFIARDRSAAPGPEELRAHLKAALPEHMVPSAFVAMQQFPISPNGKLDRKALPVPDSAAYLRRPYQVPRGKVEGVLAAIWQALLGIERLGRDENFFELGGHSLLALELRSRVYQDLGVEIPLSALIEAPTIEKLAERIVSGSPANSLVLIRAGEGAPPVFLVHDGDGEVLLYRTMSLRLDGRSAVYGLQPFALPGMPLAHTRIPDMAAYHITKIKSVQPSGPYLLGGMCAGAVIAFEMALQLQAQGERVALVALLDAADTQAVLKPFREAKQRISRVAGEFQRVQTNSRFGRAMRIGRRLCAKGGNFLLYLARSASRSLADAVGLRLARIWLDRGRPPPPLLGRVPVRTTYLFAARQYRPSRKFEGELVLFRATHGVGLDAPFIKFFADPALGWRGRSSHGVRIVDVPGGHTSMLQEPNVRVLADRLQEAIQRNI